MARRSLQCDFCNQQTQGSRTAFALKSMDDGKESPF